MTYFRISLVAFALFANMYICAAKPGTPSGGSYTPEQTKTRRQWEVWSADDMNAFFEALNEVKFGHDFSALTYCWQLAI